MLKNLKSKIAKIGFKKFVVCSVISILAISLAACATNTGLQKDIDNSDNAIVDDTSSEASSQIEVSNDTDSTTSEDSNTTSENDSSIISGDPNSNVASSSVNSSNTTSTNSVSSTTSSTSSTNSNSSESSSVSSVPVANTSNVTSATSSNNSTTSSVNSSTNSTSSEVTNESDVTTSFPTDAIVIESGETYPTIKLEVLTTYHGYVGYFTMSQSLKEAEELLEEIVPGSDGYWAAVCATEYINVETNKTVRFVLQSDNMEGKHLLYDHVYPAGAGKTKVNVVY